MTISAMPVSAGMMVSTVGALTAREISQMAFAASTGDAK